MTTQFFNYISRKISFTFAVAFFSTSWAWLAAIYGFYFVYSTVNLTNKEFYIIAISLFSGTIFVIIIHFLHYGILHKLGFSGFSKSIKCMNKYFQNEYVFLNYFDISDDDINELYNNLIFFPKNNLIVTTLYTLIVIISAILIQYFYFNNISYLSFFIAGGILTSLVHGYFTFNITEYIIGPTKSRMEDILFQKFKNFRSKYILSFRYKFIFAMLLFLTNMIILSVIIWTSNRPIIQIVIFIIFSMIGIGFLIYLLINTIRISLKMINLATKDLAIGGRGLYFPSFTDYELVEFANNYNHAAKEIHSIRANLAENIANRTEELNDTYNELNSIYKLIQKDLQLAKKIQESILPVNPEKYNGLNINIEYLPMHQIGGDLYDIDELHPGFIRIFIADAKGHGIQAALVTMLIKSEYDKLKNNLDLSVLMSKLNNSFIDLYQSLTVFFSCFIVDIDLNNNKIIYSSAGHPDQVFIRNRKISLFKSSGPLIGIINNSSYKVFEEDLFSEDKILLFTDGLFEQFNKDGVSFGEENLHAAFERLSPLPIDEITKLLFTNLKTFLNNRLEISKDDDITLLGIEII